MHQQVDGRRLKPARCIAITGPYLSGKTSLLEALLFRCRAIARQGRVADGSTVGDAAVEARTHGMGVELNAASAEFLGDRYTFLDCPGSIEFSYDMRASVGGCDAAIVVCEADEKKVPALQLILKQLDEMAIPRFLFINKIDQANLSPREVLQYLQPASAKPLILRQLPIWDGGIVKGFVDLALERAHVYHEQAESTIIDMPEELLGPEQAERFTMLERLADHDDELMEQLLADLDPPRDRVFADLAKELSSGQAIPVFFGSAEHGHGVGRLLKALRHEAPTVTYIASRLGLPDEAGPTAVVLKTFHTSHGGKLSIARVLKGELAEGATLFSAAGAEARLASAMALTTGQATKLGKAIAGDTIGLGRLEGIHTGDTVSTTKTALRDLLAVQPMPPVYGLAITVGDRKDEVKLTTAIHKLVEEDPSLTLTQNSTTKEMVMWGQGDMHLRIALERLTSKFGVKASATPRRVAYQETLAGDVQVRGRHKKQSGGHGQYGDVVIEVEGNARGAGLSFTESVTGGTVPRNYIPAVESGVREWSAQGPLGFPVVDFKVNLSDGSYHDVDSSEMAFKLAARQAMNEAVTRCRSVLLEPVLAVEIHVPSMATARVNQIVTGHRGHLLGFDNRPGWPGWDTVKAHLPDSEIASLIVELRSATAGVGTFTFAHDHMAELSGRGAEQVVTARKAEVNS